ncbi:hypothetical protein EJB05_23663, partial [Eragrostis curvula]
MVGGGWSCIPGDLLRQVSSLLTSEHDLLRFRQVCTHWCAFTPLPIAPCRPWVVARRAMPIIVGPLGDFSLWLPRGLQRVHVAGPPDLPYCCGKPRGWLALADDEQSPTRIVLWEPRSGTEIPLPCLSRVVQIFLSDDPLTTSSKLGWMAVATRVKNEICQNVFFWRPGDAAWSSADEVLAWERLHSVAFLGRNMYCIDYSQRLAIYDLNLGTKSPPMLLQRTYIASVLNCPWHSANKGFPVVHSRRCGSNKVHGARAAHFVTCNDELLVVVLFNPRHPSFVEVYKPELTPAQCMDLTPDLSLGLRERVTDLGGYSLFLGHGDGFALSAQDFPAIKRNCVYYAVHFLNFQEYKLKAAPFTFPSPAMTGGGWSSLPIDLLKVVSVRLTSECDLIHMRQSAGPPLLLRYTSRLACVGGRRANAQAARRLVLWEPCSGTEIQLPPLARVVQVFLSADPLTSSSSWMTVATQLRNERDHHIFFWRPGVDAAWVAAAEVYTGERLHSVAFLGGKMYCVDFAKRFAVYDLNLRTTASSPPVLVQRMYAAPLLNYLLCSLRCGSNKVHGTRAAHFVTCNGELLLVVLFYDRHPSFAEIYKPDLTPGRQLELGERVTDLGDFSLFLGRGDAFALSAQEFPGIKRNCVYYVVHYINIDRKHWVVVFDLESNVLEEFPFLQAHKEDPTKELNWPCSWFCPDRPVLLNEQRA